MNAALEQCRVGSNYGYIFEAVAENCFCFVPRRCVSFTAEGCAIVNEGVYLLSGWARKNALFNRSITGRLLFPRSDAICEDLDRVEVQDFLKRLGANL
jgi:hypothetical protein